MRLRVTPAEGEPFDLEMKEGSLVVGRSSTADLALADSYASRHHARLLRRGDSLLVESLGARNGTFLNDHLVVAPTEVLPGDVIGIAGSSTIHRLEEGELISDVVTSAAGGASVRDSTIARPVAEVLQESSDSVDIRGDGEALRRYLRRLETLRDLHRALSRATNRADLLRSILDWAFDLFSPEQGAIYLQASDGELRRAESRPSTALTTTPLPEAMVTRVVHERVAVATQVEAASGVDGHAPSRRSSLIAAPLLDADDCFGMLILSRDGPALPFTDEQLDLLVELAGEAALELGRITLIEQTEQRRLVDHELALARRIQLGILPGELPSFDGYTFMSRNIPSRGVSGDFYSLTLRGGREECVLFMGDVSGKGFSAALVTASVEALSAVMIEAGDRPHEICTKLSRQLFERTLPSGFVTAFVAALDRQSGRLTYTNAGHNAALLARPDGSLQKLHSIGLPLAMVRDSVYDSREVLLEPGATLLLYTDGITEAENGEGEQYGLARLETCLAKHHRGALSEISYALHAELDQFVGSLPYTDDRTILMVRRSPADSSSYSAP